MRRLQEVKESQDGLGNESQLTGTPNQVEWAEQIRLNVVQEFDRVAKAFHARLAGQTGQRQADIRAVIAILEQKRTETLANTQAGYFIREWQELSGRVRQLIADDLRYLEIRDRREARRASNPANDGFRSVAGPSVEE